MKRKPRRRCGKENTPPPRNRGRLCDSHDVKFQNALDQLYLKLAAHRFIHEVVEVPCGVVEASCRQAAYVALITLQNAAYGGFNPVEFEVCGYRIPVNDDRLAAALAKLLREKRDVILLSYFMDMSDREIGELLDMARRTVQHRRTDTLAELRKRMEDDNE